MKTNDMAYGYKDNNFLIKNSFRRYLTPSILAILGGNISFMIDHVIAGRFLGTHALATISMVNPLFFFFTAMGTLICVGSSTMASVSLGRGDRQTANKLFTLACILVLIAGGLTTATGYLLLPRVIGLIDSSAEVRLMIKGYCRGLIPGSVVIMAVYLPLNFFRIEGRGHLGMVMFLVMALLNVTLDLYFVIVHGMGMYGLALATVLSSLVAIVCVFPFLFTKGGGYRFVPIGKSIKLANGIVVVGSPFALNNLYTVLRMAALNAIILMSGGLAGVAAFSFANSVNTLAQAVISGMAQTVSPLVGVFYGEYDVTSIKRVIRLSIQIGVMSMLLYIALITLLSKQICGLFGITTPTQQTLSAYALVLCSMSFPIVMVNQILCYYYTTVGRTKSANLITMYRGVLFVIPVAVILSVLFGIKGVWIGFFMSEVLTLLVAIITARKVSAKKEGIKGVLLLDYRDIDEGRFLSFSVETNKEAVMDSAGKINAFTESSSLDPRQSMVVSLAIEEILLLILQYVFVDKEKESIDVKIFVREKNVVMRFRYGGKKFNPLANSTLENVERSGLEGFDDDAGMGLRLISKMAKHIEYTTNLGLNNIVIKI